MITIPRSRLCLLCAASRSRGRHGRTSWPRALLRAGMLIAALAMIGWAILPCAFELPHSLDEPPACSPCVLDRHGDVLDEFPRADFFRHQPVPFEEIPNALRDATLVAEDKRFYRHDGVDYLATARAARDFLREGRVVSGASTITQQLIKISSPPAERNLATKFREALTARQLESRWSKDRIFAAYLNRLDYGNHRQGCREAARYYFGKPLADLSLAEAALLAGLPQSPSLHDPRRNPQSALKRRNWILGRLATELGYDADLIAAANREPLQLSQPETSTDTPHLAASLRDRPADSAPIRTTIDRSLQRRVNAIVSEELSRLEDANIRHAAAVVLDNTSGEILAMVGSGDFRDPRGGQINGALAPRSPGSALKPFTYLLAFEQRGLSPGSVIADIPTPYRTEEGLDLPRNYDHRHHGPVTIRYALANSLNVAAMRTLNDLGGPAPLHRLLRDLGLATLSKPAADYGLGLTIGNAEVRLLELANAYATLARLGQFKPATLLRDAPASRIPDSQSPLATPEAAYLVADILSDNTARSHAFGARSALRLPFRAAVKTGTSSDFRDNWCLGFTADFTVGVWAGNFDNTPMRGVSGVTGAGPIFHRTMLALHENRAARWLPRPGDIVEITIDTRTGHRFVATVPPGQPFAARELSLPRRLPPPVTPDDYDSRGRALVDQRFGEWLESPDNTRPQDFALAADPPLDLVPRIISPMPTATYLLDPELPSGGRSLKLLSNLPADARWSSPTLTIDGDTAHLRPGRHQIVLTDPHSGQTVSQDLVVESL